MSKRFSALTVVVECGAQEVGAVIDSLRILLGPIPVKVEVLHSGDDEDCKYADSGLDLLEARGALDAGDLSSIMVIPVDESAGVYAMVFCPGFGGCATGWWDAIVEFETGYEADFIQRLRSVQGLDFVSISIEDSLDIPEGERVTEAIFPWQDWRLIEAVVADEIPFSKKEIRRGPAARKVSARPVT
jgi:hypothetical protein